MLSVVDLLQNQSVTESFGAYSLNDTLLTVTVIWNLILCYKSV